MPSIMLKNVAAGTADALTGLQFKVQNRPALVSLFASTPTAGALLSLTIGSIQVLVDAAINIEGSADVVSTEADQVLFQERVPPGEYFLPVAAQIANILLVIDPIG